MNLVDLNFAYTTAEEQSHYFSGTVQYLRDVDNSTSLPPGQYRVIDGQLRQIIPVSSVDEVKARFSQIASSKP
jgi:hypothetical protein